MNRASIALIAGVLTAWISPWASARQAASLQEILDAVGRQRASIHNIQVSVWQHTTSPMPGAMRSEHYSLILDDGKYFMEHRYDSDVGSFFVASVHNGDHGIIYQEKTKVARISTAVDHEFINSKGSGFFDLMLYFPHADGQPSSSDAADLENMLRDPGAVLQPDLVELEGVRCQIVDRLRSDQSVATRLWLDPARGFFPLKHEYYGKPGQLLVEYETLRLAEVEGVWFPVEGRRRTPPHPDISPFPIEVMIDVDVDAAGQPLVALNQRIDPAKFDYRDQLPPGTFLSNDSGEIIEVIGKEAKPVKIDSREAPVPKDESTPAVGTEPAKSPVPIVSHQTVGETASATHASAPPMPATTSSTPLWSAIVALAIAVLLLIVAVVVFRRS